MSPALHASPDTPPEREAEQEPSFVVTGPGAGALPPAAEAPAANQGTPSEVAMLPRLAEMTTALCVKGSAIVQDLNDCLQGEQHSWPLEELEASVHALHAAVSQAVCVVQLREASEPERSEAFVTLATLAEAAWSAGETIMLEYEAQGRQLRKRAAEVSLEMTVMQRRLERAEDLAALVRRYLARRAASEARATRATRRLAEREAAESAQLDEARRLHAQARIAADAFGQIGEARDRLCLFVPRVRTAMAALHEALRAILRDRRVVLDRRGRAVLGELGADVQMPLVQMGADILRLAACAQDVSRALAATRQRPAA